jgi:hypothetical protein
MSLFLGPELAKLRQDELLAEAAAERLARQARTDVDGVDRDARVRRIALGLASAVVLAIATTAFHLGIDPSQIVQLVAFIRLG